MARWEASAIVVGPSLGEERIRPTYDPRPSQGRVPGKPMLSPVDEEELAQSKDRRAPRAA